MAYAATASHRAVTARTSNLGRLTANYRRWWLLFPTREGPPLHGPMAPARPSGSCRRLQLSHAVASIQSGRAGSPAGCTGETPSLAGCPTTDTRAPEPGGG